MEEKVKELSIVAVISILTIVLAASVGVVQASEWQETILTPRRALSMSMSTLAAW